MSMSINGFLELAKDLPEGDSILIRGPHGIGKSQIVRYLSQWFKVFCLDKRLSQITAGDMVGLPLMVDAVTTFASPDWFVMACEQPCILFFDELNRATQDVMQAAFQIVLDRELNGRKLHPETRVIAAINDSHKYQVNDMDPALLDRFFVVDLVPTVEEWLAWARENDIEPDIIEFINRNHTALDPRDNAGPGEVDASRRSWERFSNSGKRAGVWGHDYKDEKEGARALARIQHLANGWLGNENAVLFTTFLMNKEKHITAEDILDNYPKMKKKIDSLGVEKWNMCVEKLVIWAEKGTFTAKQAENVGHFMVSLPGDLLITTWQRFAALPNAAENVKAIHPYIYQKIVEVMNGPNPPLQSSGS